MTHTQNLYFMLKHYNNQIMLSVIYLQNKQVYNFYVLFLKFIYEIIINSLKQWLNVKRIILCRIGLLSSLNNSASSLRGIARQARWGIAMGYFHNSGDAAAIWWRAAAQKIWFESKQLRFKLKLDFIILGWIQTVTTIIH